MRRDESEPPRSAPWWVDEDRDDPERSAERYVPGGELGRGGMGVVRGAWDAWLDRDIAVKRIHPELVAGNRERLLREASITARLVHPGIVPIYDIGEDADGTPFYTMPVLHGRRLYDAIADPDESLVALVRSLVSACQAVGYAHAHGVVHRDLTPANVLLGLHGQVWVLDWGLAVDAAAPAASAAGTQGYASPEQQSGGSVGPASDVWSLGAILAAILRRGDPDGPLPEQPRELIAIVSRARSELPTERYSEAAELGADLQRWLDGRWVKAHAYSSSELMVRLISRWRAPLVVGALASLALAGLGVWSVRANQAERDRALQAERDARVALTEARASTAAAFELEARRALAEGFLAEAEVFAGRSLELREGHGARGVLMATAASPTPELVSSALMPWCTEWVADAEGTRLACLDDGVVQLMNLDGTVLWSAPAPAPAEHREGGSRYRTARVYGDSVLALRYPAQLEVWRDGALVASHDADGPSLRLLSSTARPLISDGQRLGRVDLDTGGVEWSPRWCEVLLSAQELRDGYAVACINGLRVGPFDTPGPERVLPGGPAVLSWDEALYVGTFAGEVWRLGPETAERVADVGAPVRGLTHLGQARLAVRDERGRVSVWSQQTGSLLTRLPGTSAAVRRLADGSWLALGERQRRFVATDSLRPRGVLDVEGGGVVWLDADPEFEHIAIGHGIGAVDVWEPETGERTRVPKGPGRISKSGAFVDAGRSLVVSQLGGDPVREIEVSTNSPTREHAIANARDVVPLGPHHLVANAYTTYLTVLDRRTGHRSPVALGSLVADLVSGPTEAWVCDQEGRVSTVSLGSDGPELRQRFDAGEAGRLAVDEQHVIHASGRLVTAFSLDGEVQWTARTESLLTAVEIAGTNVVLGLEDGVIVVLDGEGRRRATVQGHERLVSDLFGAGDVVYSAGWDGAVYRWDLGVLHIDGEQAREAAEARHGLTAEALVSGGG